MKRLMFALAAAAGVALGAYAEVAELIPTMSMETYEPAPVSFEKAEYGVPAELPGAYDLDNAEFDSPADSKVWYTAAEENPTEVRAYEGATKPTGADDNFLHVETDAKPLFRTFANAAGIGKELGTQYVALDKVAVDTWVKFTAWDSEPAFAADDDAGATKFALWLQTSEDETQTNLFVKCGSIDQSWDTTPITVALDVSDIDVTAWHHVVVKTILDKTMGYYGLGCFTIKIDGAEVAAVSADYDKVFPDGYDDFLNTKNKDLAAACKLFPSMVAYNEPAAETLFGVGFQGTGDIDLLSIANYEDPVDVVEFSFKEVEGLKVAEVKTEDGTVLEAPYMVAPSTKVIVTYAAEEGYTINPTTVEYTIDAETVIDPTERVEVTKLPTATVITIADVNHEAAVEFTAQEIGLGYEDWNAKFILTSSVAIGEGEIELGGQYDATFGDNPGTWVDVPFAGCAAGEEVDVLKAVGIEYPITVETVFDVVKVFNCGVKNVALKNDAIFTLKLVITDPEGVAADIQLCEQDNLMVAKKEFTVTTTGGENATVTVNPETGVVDTEVTITATAKENYTYEGVDTTGWEKVGEVLTKVVVIATEGNEYAVPSAVEKQQEKEIKPGEIAVVEAEDEAGALAQVTIKPINDEAAAAGQAAVIKGKATKDAETGKWTVEPVINEQAPEFKKPDLVVETTLEQMVAGTDGAEVTVALPAEKVTPGLYYSVDVATALVGNGSTFVEGERVLATGTGVSLKVEKPEGGKAFFKVSEHMAPTPAN